MSVASPRGDRHSVLTHHKAAPGCWKMHRPWRWF